MSVNDARMFVFAQGDELLDINGSLVDGDGDYAGIMSVIGHLDEDYELARYTARDNNSEVVEMVRKPKPVALSADQVNTVRAMRNSDDVEVILTILLKATVDGNIEDLHKVLRAYMDSNYVVKGSKQKYQVFVPGASHMLYVKDGGIISTRYYWPDGSFKDTDSGADGKFTIQEIKKYGLYAFDREKVDD